MPQARELPPQLERLSQRQAVEIRSENGFHVDLDQLYRAVQANVGEVERRYSARVTQGAIILTVFAGVGLAAFATMPNSPYDAGQRDARVQLTRPTPAVSPEASIPDTGSSVEPDASSMTATTQTMRAEGSEIPEEIAKEQVPVRLNLRTELAANGIDTKYFLGFTLSNTGKGLAVTEELALISSYEECSNAHLQPRAELTKEYQYDVTLKHDQAFYVLDTRKFNYANNDVDSFTINLTAKRHGFYSVAVKVTYDDPETGRTHTKTSRAYRLHFRADDADEAVRRLKEKLKEAE